MDYFTFSSWAYLLNIQPKSMGHPEIDNTFYFLRPLNFYHLKAITKVEKRPRNVSYYHQFDFAFNWLLWSLRAYFLRKHLAVLK